ncbi:uncharacterized protein [Physcomitrium patens]|nr:uncharacterized protein LOC112276695 isoform X3 [Physcomitrium patens]XP_024364033.1 uncharacterized protein LOC112276695 isoform X3 [Physcomitrium patens]XP_024364034.1 uncharacterized protein LOC112276695 isoform X3 [Physcomitrium patens]|eukprot:XP_024364031.1 uncharacterized protein LOC112276695 isoform X3 [Physcomitrella patens]
MGGRTVQRRELAPSLFRKKLTQEVQRKLQKALDFPAQRGELLRQLFTDVALEVDARAQERLYGSPQAADGVENCGFMTANGTFPRVCFYEVFAQHYAQVPEDGKEILPLFLQLWSQSFVSQIFALLFHRWWIRQLFEIPRQESEGSLRYSTAFVEGASNIFWIDLQSNVRRFYSMFNYTFEEVVLDNGRLSSFPIQARQDLLLLLSRYMLYYEPADRLRYYLKNFPKTGNVVLEPADMFVTELTDQLQKVKVEPVLLHYLTNMKALKGVELRATTSTRLKTALYSFTAPGGPMYPTRPVRHAAWETLDVLFPVGRHSRHLISLFFRLLHPYYWPVSAWNFTITTIKAMYAKIMKMVFGFFGFILMIFEKIAGIRHVVHD